MKALRWMAAVFFAVMLLATASQAQATRLAVINTEDFAAENGITRYAGARSSLEREFAPVNAELRTMGTRYGNLEKEIRTLRDQAAKPGSTVSEATIRTKIEEYDKLGRDIQFKQENAKARSVTRYNTVMGPVLQDIGKAIQEYARQKGYNMIFDAAKLEAAGFVLGIGDQRINVTRDFITFYNARPASAATTTPAPK